MADRRGRIIPPHLSPDAGKWYQRHLARESELDELIQDSAYGGKAMASGAKATAIIAGKTGEGIVTGMITGALVGLAIVADAASKSPGTTISAKDVKGAVVVGAILGGIFGGAIGASEGYEKGSAEVKKDLDPSIYYRYVRYLPEYLWMGWSDQEVAYPVKLSTASGTAWLRAPTVRTQGSDVAIGHLSDTQPASCTYSLDGGPTTVTTRPDADGNCPAQPDF